MDDNENNTGLKNKLHKFQDLYSTYHTKNLCMIDYDDIIKLLFDISYNINKDQNNIKQLDSYIEKYINKNICTKAKIILKKCIYEQNIDFTIYNAKSFFYNNILRLCFIVENCMIEILYNNYTTDISFEKYNSEYFFDFDKLYIIKEKDKQINLDEQKYFDNIYFITLLNNKNYTKILDFILSVVSEIEKINLI